MQRSVYFGLASSLFLMLVPITDHIKENSTFINLTLITDYPVILVFQLQRSSLFSTYNTFASWMFSKINLKFKLEHFYGLPCKTIPKPSQKLSFAMIFGIYQKKDTLNELLFLHFSQYFHLLSQFMRLFACQKIMFLHMCST